MCKHVMQRQLCCCNKPPARWANLAGSAHDLDVNRTELLEVLVGNVAPLLIIEMRNEENFIPNDLMNMQTLECFASLSKLHRINIECISAEAH